MGEDAFHIGTRVILKPEDAEGWHQPWRSMAKEGRIGTVTQHTANRFDAIKVEFDVKRKGAKKRALWLDARDIQLAPGERS